MGKKGDLGYFERGMVVGVRRAGLSISQSAKLIYLFRQIQGYIYPSDIVNYISSHRDHL